ncbi:helicase-related protein [Pectinatus frisingensis]|uniref:helicase-related protein n=1 Tax=Pectinatus frisingensis TaxID=865 RepID=UPI0018C73C0F
MTYNDFLKNKIIRAVPAGIDIKHNLLNNHLKDFQRDVVIWALKKGKAAIFAGTGLGKTFMQCEYGRMIYQELKKDVMIFAPLAVSKQTVNEAAKFGIDVNICLDDSDTKHGINITNYERLDKFDIEKFGAIILDESSILKSQTGKVRTDLINRLNKTPYKLACTATPAPNDYMELGNHAEFLNVMKAKEMLSTFFIHDSGQTQKWRLKGHAVKDFWNWVASWAVMFTKPSDLGYDNAGYDLPPANLQQVTVKTAAKGNSLFVVEAQTLQERQRARKNTIDERIKATADLVNSSDEQWLIWCGLNEESDKLHKNITDSVEVKGSDTSEHKEKSMIGFASGEVKKLITKPSIAGFGMNWQNCHNMVFVGLNDSFEQYYQAVRRCYRYGQDKPVNVYIVTADVEGQVIENVRRKEHDFEKMQHEMISATQEITKGNITHKVINVDFSHKDKAILPKWIEVA